MMTTEAATGHRIGYNRTIGVAAMVGRGFFYPWASVVGSDGRLYVLGRGLDGDPRGVRVTVMDLDENYHGSTDGEFLGKWGAHGTDDGLFNGPGGMAFDSNNELLVVDHRNSRVQRFTADGDFLSAFGSLGDGAGQFNLAWGACVDSYDNVYVADWGNDRIQKFTPAGEFVASYGSSGRGEGEFHRPSGVCVDSDGYMYVTDWGNHRLQVLDPEGGFVQSSRGQATISKWAQAFLDTNVEEAEARSRANLETDVEFFNDDPHEESAHIEKYFWAPSSITLDSDGHLFIVDSNRHRLQVYDIIPS